MTTTNFTSAPTIKSTIAPFAWLRFAFKIQRERRALAKLSAAHIADIGLTEQDVHNEAQRPFWDVPSHWTY